MTVRDAVNLLNHVDYVWFIGEFLHRREASPGSGGTLIMGLWYLDALLPLLTFLHGPVSAWAFYAVVLRVLLLFPLLFCRLRYTEKRRRDISASFRCERPGRRLLLLWGAMIFVCVIEACLMVHFEFWSFGRP